MLNSRFLYIHIPFCDVICHYCHFYTARGMEAGDQESFFQALEKHLDLEEANLAPQLSGIYFGGGTPSASPPHLIAGFLKKLEKRIHAETEITLEANPTRVSSENVSAWRNAGVNRISLGVQSLCNTTLKRLGRAHSSDEARVAIDSCLREIPNLSCDLIYGVPEQAERDPSEHALELFRLGAKHLSLYHLSLEKNHFLHSRLPGDSFAWNQLSLVAHALEKKGFEHYEVASFSLPGHQSRNNKNYWSGGPYLALGPSAHAFDGQNTRWAFVSNWNEYVVRLQRGESPRAWVETLSPEQRRLETLFTSLRTSSGLNLQAFEEKFGENLLRTKRSWIERWEREGLARIEDQRLVLTFSGKMLADEIVAKLGY